MISWSSTWRTIVFPASPLHFSQQPLRLSSMKQSSTAGQFSCSHSTNPFWKIEKNSVFPLFVNNEPFYSATSEMKLQRGLPKMQSNYLLRSNIRQNASNMCWSHSQHMYILYLTIMPNVSTPRCMKLWPRGYGHLRSWNPLTLFWQSEWADFELEIMD